MEQALYLKDCYLREFEATVTSVKDDKYVVLDRTAFYPTSGGQPHDTGSLFRACRAGSADGAGGAASADEEFPVVYVGKFGGQISHEVSKPGLQPGDKVVGKIDWDRRYVLMRYHTAAHVLFEVIHKRTGAKATGNQLELGKGRIDFDLENFSKDDLGVYEKEANEVVDKALPVKKYFLEREEAFRNPELFSLKNVLPPDVKELRIVEIVGFDTKACGGTHLDNTKEIGHLKITRADNKGKDNRRIYFVLECCE